MDHILLIAYKFPPYAGVGCYRWSKLCKYLARIGYVVHVVTVDWKQNGQNTLLEDIEHPNIIIHKIPSGYPHNIKYKTCRNRYLNFAKNKFLQQTIDRFVFWDDEAQHWGKYLIPCCEKLIRKENISIVIATGHPFQANYWASVLKERNPGIKLIQDLRDPWVRNPLKRLSANQLAKLTKVEKKTLEVADAVVCVTDGLSEHFKENAQIKNGYVIRNGFDLSLQRNYFEHVRCLDHTLGDRKISIVHTGNVFNGRDLVADKLLNCIKSMNIDNIVIKFIGVVPMWIQKKYADLVLRRVIQFILPVQQKKVFAEILKSDFGLQLNSKYYPYALSTKIYEYAALKVPCISINYGGDIETLISDSHSGYSINLNRDDLKEFLVKLSTGKLPGKFKFNIEQYAYSNLAQKYSKVIENL